MVFETQRLQISALVEEGIPLPEHGGRRDGTSGIGVGQKMKTAWCPDVRASINMPDLDPALAKYMFWTSTAAVCAVRVRA